MHCRTSVNKIEWQVSIGIISFITAAPQGTTAKISYIQSNFKKQNSYKGGFVILFMDQLRRKGWLK